MANETKVKKWNLNAFKRFLIDNFYLDELADCMIEYMQPSDIKRVMDDYGYNDFDYSASAKKSKSVKKNYDDDIGGLIEDFIVEFDESEYGQNLYVKDFNKYSVMMNLLTDAQVYANEGDYYDAKDLLEEFRDKSGGEMDVSKLESALYFINQVYDASTKKSKVKKSISQDMEMYGGQINVSAGPGRGSQNWDFTDYCLELEDADDESALDDLCEKIDRGETSFCIHRNDGWDYDIMVIKSTKKSKVAKREWAEDNYNPVSTEEQIESAFKSQYGNKEIIKLEYVGTDWEMGSQYWILMYDEGQGTLFDEDRRYSVVTVIDWTYDNPDRGITFNFGAYELHRDVAEDVFNEKVQRESNGTRKMKKTKKASTPDVKMSFTENVNKMRVNNYAKTGNINTVMKKRD